MLETQADASKAYDTNRDYRPYHCSFSRFRLDFISDSKMHKGHRIHPTCKKNRKPHLSEARTCDDMGGLRDRKRQIRLHYRNAGLVRSDLHYPLITSRVVAHEQ